MSKTEEQELEDAEAEFSDEEQTEEQTEKQTEKQPKAENNMQILTALGFTPHYHDKDAEGNDETNFGIRVMKMKIGVKFNDKNPAGKFWAYVLTDDGKKDFIKNGDLKQLPLVQRYFDIQAGKKPIPEATVIGRIIEKQSKSVVLEIEEDREKKEVIFGLGAVKKHDDGSHFIPRGFSKPSQDNPEGKMYVPRDILLPDMDPEPENRGDIYKSPQVEAEQKAQMAPRKREVQVTSGLGIPGEKSVIPRRYPKAGKPTVKENLTVPELIAKYTGMLALVTEAIEAEDRIPEREKGYGIKFVYYSVKHALENGNKGGSQEE